MFCKYVIRKNFAKCTDKIPVFGACNFIKKRGSGTGIFLWILLFFSFTKHLFYRTLPVTATAKIYQLKYYKMICVYITIYYGWCVTQSYKPLFMHMRVSEIGKKVAKSTNAAKKVEVFIQNMFFQQTVYSIKSTINFSWCHWQYFRRRCRFICNWR